MNYVIFHLEISLEFLRRRCSCNGRRVMGEGASCRLHRNVTNIVKIFYIGVGLIGIMDVMKLFFRE